jgi:hypothetical protein
LRILSILCAKRLDSCPFGFPPGGGQAAQDGNDPPALHFGGQQERHTLSFYLHCVSPPRRIATLRSQRLIVICAICGTCLFFRANPPRLGQEPDIVCMFLPPHPKGWGYVFFLLCALVSLPALTSGGWQKRNGFPLLPS